MVISYLEQLDLFARRASVDLATACQLAGCARSTLDRWRKGQRDPSLEAANRVAKAIEILASAKIAA